MPWVLVIAGLRWLWQAMLKQELHPVSHLIKSRLKICHVFKIHRPGDSQAVFSMRYTVCLLIVQCLDAVFGFSQKPVSGQ